MIGGSCSFKVAASQSSLPLYATKFSVNRHCVSGDTMAVVCHMTLEDRLNKGSCDFIGKKLLIVVHIPATFIGQKHYFSGDILVLFVT